MRPRLSSRRRLTILAPPLALLAIAVVGCARDPEPGPSAATLVLHGGKVFTADQAQPWAEAIAIAGDRILAVGADAEVLALAGDATERIDLGGRVVVPGFNDAHVHAAAPLPSHDLGLPFDPPVPQVLDAIRTAVAATAPGTWLEGTVGLRASYDRRCAARRSTG